MQNYLPKPKFTYWIFDSTVGYLAEELMTEQNMQILQKKIHRLNGPIYNSVNVQAGLI